MNHNKPPQSIFDVNKVKHKVDEPVGSVLQSLNVARAAITKAAEAVAKEIKEDIDKLDKKK